ncbi:hypothetical protein JKF63_03330 [Porcisia hertigi]|uniref:Cyclic nucleotide-binding domain-containing protein n=1 Tax=Porcisia hertigi TaxID=2761500 RepID=A0A836L775_9TRYP|nr:hypothetical protein JKF63_03330 [Porcisia hertigi]
MSTIISPDKSDMTATDGLQHRPSLHAIDLVRKLSQRDSALPLCMSRAQQEARRQSASATAAGKRRHRRSSVSQKGSFSGAPVAVQTANGWGALLSFVEASTEVGRAVQMCSFYPSMRIGGTAFENSLNLAHRQSFHFSNGSFSSLFHGRTATGDGGSIVFLPDDPIGSPMKCTAVVPDSSAGLRETLEESRSAPEISQSDLLAACSGSSGVHGSIRSSAAVAAADAAARTLSFSGGGNMVQVACALKRAAMWGIVITTVLGHRIMELRFRRQRLRRVLERHLLPTLLRRKKRTGSVVVKGTRSRASGNYGDGAPADGPSALPEGTYLRDHNVFFDSLHSASLLQSFAEKMTRQRFLPGDIIARAGDASQKSLYFLISGKCEVCTERPRPDDDSAEPADEMNAACGSARQQQRKNSGPAAPELIKEVVMAGTSIGGVFGGNAFFLGTYRALSQCIVWVLQTEDFEQIFRKFADRAMLDTYKEAIRQHSLWWLQQRYNPAKCYSSIPIYRKLTRRMSTYLCDFIPVVKTRGEKLLSQGDAAGDVYCLLEGTVLRRTMGADGTYGDDGVMQRLGTNSLTALNVPGRYLMFGEEPHLVPGVQPYTCTVSSRVALFFQIRGEQFVNALLDDPQLYAQLREQVMHQRQSNMRLHPECLAYVPLLQRFPAEKREELVKHAQPRVISRSVSVCDPGQHLSDLFIIVKGFVRDTRDYSHKPTAPLKVPASCEVENLDGTQGEDDIARALGAGGGAKAYGRSNRLRRRQHASLSPSSKHAVTRDTLPASNAGGHAAAATAALQRSDGGARDSVVARQSTVSCLFESAVGGAAEAVESDGIEWDFSFNNMEPPSPQVATMAPAENFTSLKGGGASGAGFVCAASGQQLLDSAPLAYPNETEEINPPLPLQPARRFVSSLAGSWEALLLEKWPNGWESVSTVEMWVIPTRIIRLAFNSCPKPVQLSILNGLRLAQKEDLNLPTVPLTKMPPMSIYAQHGEAAVTVSISAARGNSALRTKGASQRGAARQIVSPPRAGESVMLGGEEHAMCDAGTKHLSGSLGADLTKASTRSGAVKPFKDDSRKKVRLLVPVTATQTAHEVVLPLLKEGISQTSRNGAETAQVASSCEDDTQANASQSRTQDDRARSLRRLREAAAARALRPVPTDPSVNAVLLECYNGVPGAADPLMLRIVRDPVAVVPKRPRTRLAMPVSDSAAAQGLPLITSSSEASSAVAWPTLTPAKDRWFQVVPSYEPLPGTVNAAQTVASPPAFTLNSTVLAAASISSPHEHTKTLEGHMAYYAATVSPSHAPSRVALSEAAVSGATVAATIPGLTPTHSPSPMRPGISRCQLPKRWAYAS